MNIIFLYLNSIIYASFIIKLNNIRLNAWQSGSGSALRGFRDNVDDTGTTLPQIGPNVMC